MQYMLAIFEDESPYSQGDAWQQIVQAHTELVAQMQAAGILRGGNGLKPSHTATTLHSRNKQSSLHDGPYAETKEQLGGFYLIDVPDLDTAITWAKRIPLLGDGAIEIRPTIDE